MSVRVTDRKEGRLQILEKSRLLLDYTYDKITSDKVYPKSVRWLLPKNIWEHAQAADACIDLANAIKVENAADLQKRRTLQKDAWGHLKHLERLVDLSYRKKYLSADQTEFWIRMILDARSALSAWMKSDKERYKGLT